MSIAAKIGCVPQTLHEWVKKVEVDSGKRASRSFWRSFAGLPFHSPGTGRGNARATAEPGRCPRLGNPAGLALLEKGGDAFMCLGLFPGIRERGDGAFDDFIVDGGAKAARQPL